MRPAANPLAVMEVRAVGRSVTRVACVVPAAGADRPRPARLAIGLVVDVMRIEKRLLLLPRHAFGDGAETVVVGAGEAMAQRDFAVGRDAHEADAGAARIRLRVS